MMNTLTASHVAYTINTTDCITRGNDNQYYDYNYVVHRVYQPWYCMSVYTIKLILWRCMVRLVVATYVYIPHPF